MFSHRSDIPTEHNRIAHALAERAHDASALFDLTVSNPTAVGLGGDVAPLAAAIARGEAEVYTAAPFGLATARAAVAQHMTHHGIAMTSDRIVLTASTSEAYAFLFKLLCDAGDEVLVPAPSYPLFEHLTRLEGVRAVPYPLRYDGHWHVSRAELRAACSQRSRAVLLVHPNNPTGSFFDRDALAHIAELGLAVISDEVFAAYAHADSGVPRSVLEVIDSGLVCTLHGLSKQAALPQLKLSWIALGGDTDRCEQALARLEVIADSYLSLSAPVQHALPDLLAASTQTVARIRERLRHNLARLDAHLSACAAVDRLRLDAGWYATLRVPAIHSDEAWVLCLLEHDDVRVQPGYFFDFEGGPYLVLSLLAPPQRFEEGVRRLLARVESELLARPGGGAPAP